MKLSWINDFAAEIARIGKRWREDVANSPKPEGSSSHQNVFEFLDTVQTFEEAGRKNFQTARAILKQGLAQYWEAVDAWNRIAVAEGDGSVAQLKGGLLRVLTGARKADRVYMNYDIRIILEWMSCYGDSYEALWSERLAFLFFEAYGSGDKQRQSYVTNLFYAIKTVTKIQWENRRDKSVIQLCEQTLKILVSRFETVVSGFADPAQKNKWEPIVVHYKLKVGDNDDELAKLFLSSRAAYNKDMSSAERLRQYAWVVHDCINRAIQLANIKLVETFSREGKRLQSQFKKIPLTIYLDSTEIDSKPNGLLDLKPTPEILAKSIEYNAQEPVVQAIETDMKRAERFLAGEGEAAQWMRKGDIPKAIAAYKEGLERDENNREARIGLIELYLRNADVASASNLLIDGLVTVEFVKRLTKVIRSAFFSWKSCFFKQAEFYLTCVEKLGDDLATLASTNFSVAECLYHCALAKKYLSGEVLVLSHQLVITVFEDLFKRGVKWPKERQTVAGCLGRLLLASGRIDEARPYIKETLVSNPESPIAWTDYGRTFGKESIDAAKCFCRAICCPSAKASLTLTAHELLGEYFETTGQMPRALREYNTCDAIRRRNGWRPHSRSLGIYLTNLMNDTKTPAPVPSNEDVYAKLSASAGEFLSTGTTDVRGVIVSVLKSNVRVWCESPNEEGRGFFTYVARGGITDLVRGTPVWVSLNQFRNTKVVASWSIRTDGVPWDIYPIEVGVVTKVDFNRGFWHIVLGCDVELSVGADRVPSVVGIPVGAFVQVRKVETAGVPEILAVSPVKAPLAMPTFVRRVEGVCVKSKQSRFGRIDDVFVPERLCKDVPSGTQMAVFAVEVEDHRKKKKGWLAFAPAQDDLRRMDVACG